MQKSICLFLTFFSFAMANAQFKPLAEGQIFDEPEDGFCKILQMKSGYTLYFHFSFKDGVDVTPYDAKHKQGTLVHFDPLYGKIPKSSPTAPINGIYEIGGDAVVFVTKLDGREPTLYRIIIDGKSGKLKDDKLIGSLEKITYGQAYSIGFGGVPVPGFYVKKDPYSDNYAIVVMHSFEPDRNKRIEIFHYGADHNVIAKGFFKSPNDYYKYLNYVDMTVMGKDKVCVLGFAYNTKSSGGKASELLIANLQGTDASVPATKLDFTKDYESIDGLMKYNPVSKKLIVVIAAKERAKDNSYTPYIAYIDPLQKKLEYSAEAYPTAAINKSAELFGEKKSFFGLPQNVYINKDGSFVIVYEEISLSSSTRSGTLSTNLGNAAVASYKISGEEAGSYLIPKSQFLPSRALYPFYLSEREGQTQKMDGGDQYKSFSYVDGLSKSYVLFNDVSENEEKISNGKRPTTISGVGACDAFAFALDGKNILPARKYVFGEPGKKEHNLAVFCVSDYDRENNMYVTLKLAKEGRDKGVQVVWLQPQ